MMYRMLICLCLFAGCFMLGCGSSVSEVAPSDKLEAEPIPTDVEAQMNPDYMMEQAKKAQEQSGGAAEGSAESSAEGGDE